MRIFQDKIEVEAPPSTIFSIYEDVENWKQWDHDVTHSTVDKFDTGGKGVLKPSKGPQVRMRLAEVTKDTSFASEYRMPLCTLRLDYLIEPAGEDKTVVTHQVTFSGPLSFVFGRLFAGGVRRGLPAGLGRLKNLAEAKRG
jgi:hypothetical protein